jgi:flavin reductase (DIM6/NTAB) family NADH-FMN oxidoreductase RutF
MILDPPALSRGAFYQWMIAAIVPRPIAFVSTISASGRTNLAPFSFFNGVSAKPPLVSISINQRSGTPKDTMRNLRETGDFVVNVVHEPLFERMVQTSGDWPEQVSEFELTGLTAIASDVVRAPRLGESPVSFECRLHREIELGDTSLVIGEIVRGHVDEAVVTDGRLDVEKLRPIARLGADGYTTLGRVLRLARPKVEPPAGA